LNQLSFVTKPKMGLKVARDPYPFPKLEGDVQFRGEVPKNKRPRSTTSEAQAKDPWNRLFETPTLASARREIFHHDRNAPVDSLDFELKSMYDHHNELMKEPKEILQQSETNGNPGGRILKNRKKEAIVEDDISDGFENKLLQIIEAVKREDINNHDGAIPSHHNAATNRGYSRKHDGGIFSI